MAEAGSIIWPSQNEPLWRFTWRLADSPDEEGIVITNAYFRGFKLLHKASLPIIRVQYDGGAGGPYKDPLNYNNSRTTSRCPSNRVCIHSYVSGGLRGLNIDSYHRIGAYHLIHRWVFWETGHIYALCYSAGLQHNANHRHHAYWRFDFDIEQGFNNLALEYNTYAPDVGWGRGWEPIIRESSRVKYPPSRRSWAVLNKSLPQRGCHIYPGPNDGVADTFSTRDVWLMRYNATEDKSGRQGSAYNDELNNYLNNEDIDGQDIVVWYCGHLYHAASHGGDEYHSVGPTLTPFRY